jgi:hypothetical protein
VLHVQQTHIRWRDGQVALLVPQIRTRLLKALDQLLVFAIQALWDSQVERVSLLQAIAALERTLYQEIVNKIHTFVNTRRLRKNATKFIPIISTTGTMMAKL